MNSPPPHSLKSYQVGSCKHRTCFITQPRKPEDCPSWQPSCFCPTKYVSSKMQSSTSLDCVKACVNPTLFQLLWPNNFVVASMYITRLSAWIAAINLYRRSLIPASILCYKTIQMGLSHLNSLYEPISCVCSIVSVFMHRDGLFTLIVTDLNPTGLVTTLSISVKIKIQPS